MVLADILVAPDGLAARGGLEEVTTAPEWLCGVGAERVCVAAVVAEIAVGQYHGVATRAHRHVPAMHDLALDIDEVDGTTTGLECEQRVAACALSEVESRQADTGALE